MIYVLRLFEVDATQRVVFTSAFDYGGLWQEIAAALSGHLFTHLLRHEGKRHVYLAIEFWDTEEHFMRSRSCAQVRTLYQWIRSSTRVYVNLGMFHFRGDNDGASGQ